MTDYLVFACGKCGQYTYAKTSQKGKKCPRCGRNHKVNSVNGRIVDGCTAAMKTVKKLQDRMYKNSETFESSQPVVKLTSSALKINHDGNIAEIEPKTRRNTKSNSLQKLLASIYEFQQNEHITADSGFPIYILELLIDKIAENQKEAEEIHYKITQDSRCSSPTNGMVFYN